MDKIKTRSHSLNNVSKLNTYTYKAIDDDGNTYYGDCRAKTKIAAKVQLKAQGIKIKSLKKQQKNILSTKSVKDKEIVFFTRYLATMIRSGIPIIQSLEVCINATSNPLLKEMTNKIKTSVQNGHSFSEALALYPKYFDNFYRNLLKIGESSGKLDVMLEKVAEHLEKMYNLKSKFIRALLYPSIIVIVSILVTSILLIYVVPQFEDMFNNLNAELPWFTQTILNISTWLQFYWFRLLTVILIAFYMLEKLIRNSDKAKNLVDRSLIKMPIIGTIVDKLCMARFARTLTTMLSSGIPLLSCLPAAANLVDNSLYKAAINSVQKQVETGQSLNVAMQNTHRFSPMVVQMTAIGESSGSLDEMLAKIAELYEDEVDNSVENLSTVIEPIIILIISTIVGGLIIAMYLPIFTMGSVL